MTRPDPRDQVDTDAAAEAQFVHGLLGSLGASEVAGGEQRLDRLFSALDGEEAGSVQKRGGIRSRRFTWAAAAVVVLAIGVAGFLVLRDPSAGSFVENAVEASRNAPSRRYEISVFLTDENATPTLTGELDLVRGEKMLVRAQAHGHDLKAGRNEEGSWFVDAKGALRRIDGDHPWPRWFRLGGAKILVNAVDDLLPGMGDGYDIDYLGTETLARFPGKKCARVAGRRTSSAGPTAERVDLWFDPVTHLVVRMELRWDVPSGTGVAHTHEPVPPQVLHDHLHRLAAHLHGPRLLIFELAGTPDFPEDWFRPEAHIE
ncbi:MAG: hypothetical protein CMJ83_05955 [Planctomycetes bacterium]|nr:hypothetical protein [Planctomycetota bacterium]